MMLLNYRFSLLSISGHINCSGTAQSEGLGVGGGGGLNSKVTIVTGKDKRAVVTIVKYVFASNLAEVNVF